MRVLKRILIALAGGTVLLLGTAMIVLPGPAIFVIPAGLAILAIEFHWARRWLEKARQFWPRKTPAAAAPPSGDSAPEQLPAPTFPGHGVEPTPAAHPRH